MGKRGTDHIRTELMQATQRALRQRLGPAEPKLAHPTLVHGIAFSPAMVRALHAGTKTQTRRAGTGSSSRFGTVGDTLYVRERVHIAGEGGAITYAADVEQKCTLRFRPAIYMPRHAARLMIRISELRQERLQSITLTDAIAEGCPSDRRAEAVDWYHGLWDEINTTPGSRWCDDPVVWVIRFEVLPMPGQAFGGITQVPRRGERGAASRRSNQ